MRSILPALLPALLLVPAPLAQVSESYWDSIQVAHSGDPIMSLSGYWSVAVDLGPDFRQEHDASGPVAYGWAEAEARGAQVFGHAYHSMQTPYDVQAEDEDYWYQLSISAVALSWFSVVVTWHQKTTPNVEGMLPPTAACAILVELEPEFTAWIDWGIGSGGANATAEMALHGWVTEAIAIAQRALWKPHASVPVGGEHVPLGGTFHVQAEDWEAASTKTEEVTGHGFAFVAAGGEVSPVHGTLTLQECRIDESRPAMHVHGRAMVDSYEAIVDVYYGWF